MNTQTQIYQREFSEMHKILPEGETERFKIEYQVLSEDTVRFNQMRDSIHGNSWLSRGLKANYPYCVLKEKGKNTWMSDTPMEQNTNKDFIQRANGDVLIFGLGIGLIIAPLLKDKNIKSIVVVEKDKEVIDFISKYYKHKKLKIVEGDAYINQFSKTQKFDTIYFDIWPTICSDNYENMLTLHKLYRSNLRSKKDNANAFMDSWVRDYCKRDYLKEKRERKNDYWYQSNLAVKKLAEKLKTTTSII